MALSRMISIKLLINGKIPEDTVTVACFALPPEGCLRMAVIVCEAGLIAVLSDECASAIILLARGSPGRYAGMLEMAGLTQEVLEDITAAAEPSDAAEPSEEATFHLTGHKPALGPRFPNSSASASNRKAICRHME